MSGDRFDVADAHIVAIGETQIFYCYPRCDRLAYVRSSQHVALDLIKPAA